MPIMTVTTLEGKTKEQKVKLARDLTDYVNHVMQRPREIIRVIYNDVPYGDYAIAGEMLEKDKHEDDTILRIAILSGRTSEEKREIIGGLRGVLENNPAFSKGAIRIIIEENGPDNFFRSR